LKPLDKAIFARSVAITYEKQDEILKDKTSKWCA